MNNHQFGHRSGRGAYKNVKWDSKAEVYGSPSIENSHVMGGKIFDSPLITRCEIYEDVLISGSAYLIDSYFYNKAIIADKAFVTKSVVTGNAKVLDNGNISNVFIQGNAIVCGSAMVMGTNEKPVRLSGEDYLDRGTWKRSPLTHIALSGFVVSESVGNLVTVSCTTNTFDKWLGGAGRKYGRLVGLREHQIDEIQGYVESIRDGKISSLGLSGIETEKQTQIVL